MPLRLSNVLFKQAGQHPHSIKRIDASSADDLRQIYNLIEAASEFLANPNGRSSSGLTSPWIPEVAVCSQGNHHAGLTFREYLHHGRPVTLPDTLSEESVND